MTDDVLAYGLGLHQTMFSPSVLTRLCEQLGGPEAAWHSSEAALKTVLNASQIEKLLALRGQVDPKARLAMYQKAGIQVLSLDHEAYPKALREIYQPPFLLYVRGDLKGLEERPLAVVGTRRLSEYGRQVTPMLIEQLAPYQPCIVSGLAAGIDTLAHQTALTHGLPTVAIFGCGIDQIYPTRNAGLASRILDSGGALVSEYPMGFPGDKYTFPKRNRIIAGLSEGTLVIEGDLTSGAMITARIAVEENRHVMAVPGTILSSNSRGPHRLIQDGASPICSGQDIAKAMNWDTLTTQQKLVLNRDTVCNTLALSPVSLAMLTPSQRSVLAVLDVQPLTLDVIQDRLLGQMSLGELQTALTLLELEGHISALPGTQFCKNVGVLLH